MLTAPNMVTATPVATEASTTRRGAALAGSRKRLQKIFHVPRRIGVSITRYEASVSAAVSTMAITN